MMLKLNKGRASRGRRVRTRAAIVLPIFAATLFAALGGPVVASAATVTVNDTTDAARDPSAPSGQCQSTNGGSCTLRAAIQAANQAGGTQVINLQAGATYNLTLAHASSSDCTTEDGRDGDLHITSSLTINGNGATVQGGANWTDRVILVGARVLETGPAITVTLNNLTIRNGHTADVACNTPHGGGIRNSTSGVTMLNAVVVRDNSTAGSGGGDSGGNKGGEGGGVHNNGGQMVLNNVAVSNNVGHSEGGGVANEASMTLNGVAISGNDEEPPNGGAACGGGGMINDGTANLTNVTFYRNTATFGGGGYTQCNKGDMTNVTFSDNRTSCANCGDNLALFTGRQAAPLVTNVILANPGSNGNCGTASSMNAPGDAGHNLSSDGSCGFSSAKADIVGVDPLLGPFQLNPPGSTPTMSVAPPSRAVDAGDVSACPSTDQRGVARKADGSCDIGAYEYVAAAATAPTPTPSSPKLPPAGRGPVPGYGGPLAALLLGFVLLAAAGIAPHQRLSGRGLRG